MKLNPQLRVYRVDGDWNRVAVFRDAEDGYSRLEQVSSGYLAWVKRPQGESFWPISIEAFVAFIDQGGLDGS